MSNAFENTRLKKEVYDWLISIKDSNPFYPEPLHKALDHTAAVMKLIGKFAAEHPRSLSCGADWLYQSDEGQVDALELVARILICLEDYADKSEDDDDE